VIDASAMLGNTVLEEITTPTCKYVGLLCFHPEVAVHLTILAQEDPRIIHLPFRLKRGILQAFRTSKFRALCSCRHSSSSAGSSELFLATRYGHGFLLRDALLSAVYAVVVCLSVCLCVCVCVRHTPVLYQND